MKKSLNLFWTWLKGRTEVCCNEWSELKVFNTIPAARPESVLRTSVYSYAIRDSVQGWVYRIENLSNADISDFFVYRIVYRIEPPISSISIFSKPVIFLSFFVENSPKIQKIPRKFWKPMNQSPQQQQQRRKFQKFAENSENLPKFRWKFLKKKVFFEALISYRIVSYREKNPHIVSISYRVEKKLIALHW